MSHDLAGAPEAQHHIQRCPLKIRSLRPEFFADAKMAQLSPLARLLFQGLWCIADDYGRGRYNPKSIEGEVFPHETVDIHTLLRELLELNRLVIYAVGDEQYFHIPTFERHHKPSRRFDSKLPQPPSASNGHTLEAQSAHNVDTTDAHSVDVSISLTLSLTAEQALERWAKARGIRTTPRFVKRWTPDAQEFLAQHPDITEARIDRFFAWASQRGVNVPGGWSSFWSGWPEAGKRSSPDCARCGNARQVGRNRDGAEVPWNEADEVFLCPDCSGGRSTEEDS